MRPYRALTLAVIATAACSSEAPTPTESGTPAHPATPASLSSGIVFGMFGFAPSDWDAGTRPDTLYTGGAITDRNVAHAQNQLQVAQNKGLAWWYNVTDPDETLYFVSSTNHDFDLAKWKAEFNSNVCPAPVGCPHDTSEVSLSKYINDGTLKGTWLLDDMAKFTNGTPSYSDLEAMGALAKRRFPGIATAVRQRPTELEKLNNVGTGTKQFVNLDAGWAQYNSRQVAINQYVSDQNAAASRHGLKMVYGINVSDGGDNTGAEVTQAQLKAWGTPMLTNSSTCSFIMWNETYSLQNTGAMDSLSKLAKQHATRACR